MASFQNDGMNYCKVTSDYPRGNSKELKLVKGEIVVILNKHTGNEGWWEGEKEENGKIVRGVLPSHFVVELTANDAKEQLPADSTWDTSNESDKDTPPMPQNSGTHHRTSEKRSNDGRIGYPEQNDGTNQKTFKIFGYTISSGRNSDDKSQASRIQKRLQEHERKMEELKKQTDKQAVMNKELKRKHDEERTRREAEEEEYQRKMKREYEEQQQRDRIYQEKEVEDRRKYKLQQEEKPKIQQWEMKKQEQLRKNKGEKEYENRREEMNRSHQQDMEIKQETDKHDFEEEKRRQHKNILMQRKLEKEEEEREKRARLEKEREQILRKEEEKKWRQQREKEDRERELELKEHQQRLMRLTLEKKKNAKIRKVKLEQKMKQLEEQNLRAEQIDRERREQIKKEVEASRIKREKEMERLRQEEEVRRKREMESHEEKLEEIDAKLAEETENIWRFESEAAERIRRVQEESLRFAQMRGQASGAAMKSAMKQNYERGMQDAMIFMKEKMENAEKTEMNGLVVMYDESESSRGIAGVVGDIFRMRGFIVPPAVPLEGELPPIPQQCRLEWLVMYIVINEESSYRTSTEKASQYLNHPIFCNCSKLFILQILQPGSRDPEESLECAKTISIVAANPEYHKEVEEKLKTAGERFKKIAHRLKSDAKQRSDCFVQG